VSGIIYNPEKEGEKKRRGREREEGDGMFIGPLNLTLHQGGVTTEFRLHHPQETEKEEGGDRGGKGKRLRESFFRRRFGLA